MTTWKLKTEIDSLTNQNIKLKEKYTQFETQLEEFAYKKSKSRILANGLLKFDKEKSLEIMKNINPCDYQKEISLMLLKILGVSNGTWPQFLVFCKKIKFNSTFLRIRRILRYFCMILTYCY